MFDVLCSNYSAKYRSRIVYGDEWAIFAPVGGVSLLPNLETETITPAENSICFLQSTPMPLGSTCEPSSCMSSLFHWEFFSSSFSSSRRERGERGEREGGGGRRGGATQIQRLICLLVKRNSRPHFLMRALIKSGGVWPWEWKCGGGCGGCCREILWRGGEIRFLPSVAIWEHPTGVKKKTRKKKKPLNALNVFLGRKRRADLPGIDLYSSNVGEERRKNREKGLENERKAPSLWFPCSTH